MTLKNHNLFVVTAFLVFAYFLLLNNFFDWDMFYTFFEVDLRSWIVDKKLPLWSYQFCGGVTRIGDPQSFGLSPLFLINIIFGTIIGSKLQIFVAAIWGFVFLRKTLILYLNQFFPSFEHEQEHEHAYTHAHEKIIDLVALSAIFSNYFLWHFIFGHITFALIYYLFAFVYFVIKSFVQAKKISFADYFFAFISLVLVFSAGFYHSVVFFLLPIGISFALTIVIFVIVRNRGINFFYSIKNIVIVFLLAILCCSYKVLAVINYQSGHPRTIKLDITNQDYTSLFDTLLYHLLPSFDYKLLGIFKPVSAWGIWELSSFSLNTPVVFFIVTLGLLLFLLKRNRNHQMIPSLTSNDQTLFLTILLLSFFVVCTLFSIGNFGTWSPYALINKNIFHNSIRVSSRFSVGLVYAFTIAGCLLLTLWMKKYKKYKKTEGIIFNILFVLLIVNILFNNDTLKTRYLKWFYNIPSVARYEPMKYLLYPSSLELVPPELSTVLTSYMYAFTLNGKGTIGCINYLEREHVLDRAIITNRIDNIYTPLIAESASAECIQKSYFTQNELFIDKSCSQNICLNLNSIRDQDRKNYSYDKNKKKYCRMQI
ncbi:MAG: hypothetical protein HQK49_11540 [Oligoflexia bacterium]|nr:hypothetical protein [Oligoflexia bacterium]